MMKRKENLCTQVSAHEEEESSNFVNGSQSVINWLVGCLSGKVSASWGRDVSVCPTSLCA